MNRAKRNQIYILVLTAYPPTRPQAKLDAPALGQMNLCLPKHPDDMLHCKTIPFHPDLPIWPRFCHNTNSALGPVFGGQVNWMEVVFVCPSRLTQPTMKINSFLDSVGQCHFETGVFP